MGFGLGLGMGLSLGLGLGLGMGLGRSNHCISAAGTSVRADAGTKLHRIREIRTCIAETSISVQRAIPKVEAPTMRFDPYDSKIPKILPLSKVLPDSKMNFQKFPLIF